MKRVYWCVPIFFIFILLILVFKPVQTLVIRRYEPKDMKAHGQILRVLPIKDGEVFILTSIHSVSKTPIEEFIYPEEGAMKLKEVRYVDQGGAGMPEYNWGTKEKFENKGDYFVISGFDRSFKELVLNIQILYKNKLTIGRKELDLTNVVKDGKRIILSIESVPFWKCLR